jgi:hypothetical protein
MSKSIHTTVASARCNNSRSELAEPDNEDIAALAKKRGYKKRELADRKANDDTVTAPRKRTGCDEA